MSNYLLRPIVGMTLAGLLLSHAHRLQAQVVVATPAILLPDIAEQRTSRIDDAAPKTAYAPQALLASARQAEPLNEVDGSLGSPLAAAEDNPQSDSISYLPEQLPISRINIDVRTKTERGNSSRPRDESMFGPGRVPAVQAAPSTYSPTHVPMVLRPTAASIPYKPLYFEEVNLERYGRSRGVLQPAFSAVRFFGTVPLLPYAMTNRPPNQTYCWSWPYPAGWCAPRVRELPPLNPRAAAVEASALTGAFFLIP